MKIPSVLRILGCAAIGITGALLAGVTAYSAVPELVPPPYDTGQTGFGQSTVEAAFDDITGNIVFLLTPNNAPFPSNSNKHAQDNLYLPVYPTASTIPATDLDCQPTNCNHLNVLPFYNAAYDSNTADAAGTSQACVDYNGGAPCTVYKGHDHLVGVPSTGGAFNVAWSVQMVLFTPQGFSDGAINTRITTLNQITALVGSGDATVAPTPIVFNCQVVPETVYNQGAPLSFPFP